jgi:hypothetical protein
VYGFDTGFITYVRGWQDIRDEDRGMLWEHLVLDTLRTITDEANLYFWRDKSGHEVDFVLRRGRDVDAIECKVNPAHFKGDALYLFRKIYPQGRNYLVCPGVNVPWDRRVGEMIIRITGCQAIMKELG